MIGPDATAGSIFNLSKITGINTPATADINIPQNKDIPIVIPIIIGSCIPTFKILKTTSNTINPATPKIILFKNQYQFLLKYDDLINVYVLTHLGLFLK